MRMARGMAVENITVAEGQEEGGGGRRGGSMFSLDGGSSGGGEREARGSGGVVRVQGARRMPKRGGGPGYFARVAFA